MGAALLLGACSSPGAVEPQDEVAAVAGAGEVVAVGPDAEDQPDAHPPDTAYPVVDQHLTTTPPDAADRTGAEAPLPLRSVTEVAADLEAASEGQLGVVVIDLQTRERTSHRPHDQVHPASLYKLFVAATALHLVDRGILTLDTTVGGGACASVETAMSYLITVSDNACALTLASSVGWNVVESFVRQHGYDDTSFELARTGADYRVEGLSTSASDVADLLRDLAEGDLLSPASTAHLTGLLEAQHYASLSEALAGDPGLVFRHKLGTLDSVSHDAGIVTVDGRAYVVVAVTSGWPTRCGRPGGADAGGRGDGGQRVRAGPGRPGPAPGLWLRPHSSRSTSA